MKRRDLFKMFATLAAMPLVAPLAALCKPNGSAQRRDIIKEIGLDDRPMYILTDNATRFDWSNNPSAEAAGHVKLPPEGWDRFGPLDGEVAYVDPGRMPTYEGVVYGGDGTRLWRFDATADNTFKCRNCDLTLLFSREDFRQHGQKCNSFFGEQS